MKSKLVVQRRPRGPWTSSHLIILLLSPIHLGYDIPVMVVLIVLFADGYSCLQLANTKPDLRMC